MAGNGTYVNTDELNFPVSAPWSMVSERFDTSQVFAENAYKGVVQHMQDLQMLLTELSVPNISGVGDIQAPEITPVNIINRPSIGALSIDTTIPEFNKTAPALKVPASIPAFNLPIIGFTAPQWNAINKPSLANIALPGAAPGMTQPIVPVAPSIVLPAVPQLANIVIPSAPQVLMPSFDVNAPAEDLVMPDSFVYSEPTYQSDMWTELMEKVLNDIRNGGTGLDIAVEDSIWARALYRLQDEKAKSLRELEKKLGASGFDLPTGALSSALLDLEADWARKVQEQGWTITEAQAKLAQTNTHFMIEQGIKCEELLRNFFKEQNNRVLEALKQSALVGIEIYKGAVQLHATRIEQYKAEASVFEVKVKAAQQELEIFKTQIEASKVTAEVQSLLVDIYQKQIGAVEMQIKLYLASLESAKVQSEINGFMIQSYKTSVDAYVAQLSGEKLKIDIYTAELEGEKGKSDIYKSQVDAFTASVNAEAKKTDAYIATNDATIKENAANIEIYKADIMAYNAHIDSLAKIISAKVDGFQAEVSAYNAETTAETAYYSALEVEMRTKIEAANFKLQHAIAEIDATTKGYISLNTLRVEGSKGIMDVGAQLTASSLTAVHASASLGFNSGESRSESWSHGDQISESHQFDETPV